MVLEDEPRIRKLLGAVLRKRKHSVREASRVREALDLARAARFDLILLDQRLPDGSALDFCQALPAEARQTPKLLITGEKPLDWNADFWASFGVKGYLVKPVPFPELLEAIQPWLA